MNATSTISCIVQDVIPGSNGLKVHWADDHVSFFHYIWLADNAPEFRNSQGHRIHDSTVIPITIRPRFIHFHQNNVLEIGWDEFPHTTCFSTVWLREHCYSAQSYTCRGIGGYTRDEHKSKLCHIQRESAP